MSYDGLLLSASTETPHLGGNIIAGDPFTYCPTVWDYVIDRFCVTSAMDIGSGCGHASAYMHKRGVKVIAIEGLMANVEVSAYPAIQHDLTKGPVFAKVDLVHCQEVVEHIDAKYLRNLLVTFGAGRYVLMTHGVPGQSGYHHVNLQPQEYWVDRLAERGFALMVEDTSRVRLLAGRDGAKYMIETGMIFRNDRRI